MITQATTFGLLPATPMITSYDAPARPQHWQIHKAAGVGIYFVAFNSSKSKLSGGEWFAGKTRSRRAQWICQYDRVRPGHRDGKDYAT
jgi:hypothetical protein